MKESWQLPEQFKEEFISSCAKAANDSEAYKTFLEDDRINTVIENTPQWWAEKALFKMVETRPTKVRYSYTHWLIRKLIGKIDGMGIVEIGAGYGGQCEVINEELLFDFKSYIIYDLKEVVELQKKYLHSRNIYPQFRSEIKSIQHCDFLLAWCSWSELDYDTRQDYVDKVISKADHFLICANMDYESCLEQLKDIHPDLKTYSDELVENIIYK